MKFIVIQENGRHEKNRDFRECFCIQRSILSLGHICDIWGLGHPNYLTSPDFNDYDVIIDVENYDKGWVPNLSQFKPYKALWVIDAHCSGMGSYLSRFNSGKYDIILQATRSFVDKNSIWFPNCFDETLIKPIDIPKTVNVGFCGNIVNRSAYLDLLKSKFNLRPDIFVIGEDMVKAINSYKMHFNKNIGDDINYRNFETIGCRVALITNYNDQYKDLGFIDGNNCMIYKNDKELIDKINTLLENNELLEKISNNGYYLSKEHTYTKRMHYLVKIIQGK